MARQDLDKLLYGQRCGHLLVDFVEQAVEVGNLGLFRNETTLDDIARNDARLLEEIADAYHMFSSKLDNIIKPVLIPPSVTH